MPTSLLSHPVASNGTVFADYAVFAHTGADTSATLSQPPWRFLPPPFRSRNLALHGVSELSSKRSTGESLEHLVNAHSSAIDMPTVFTLRAPHSEIVALFPCGAPAWAPKIIPSFETLLNLPDDSNSYDVARVSPENVIATIRLLTTLLKDRTKLPAIVPTSRGTIDLEWHTRGIDLVVRVASASEVQVSFEDLGTGEEWDRDLRASNLTPLLPIIARLS